MGHPDAPNRRVTWAWFGATWPRLDSSPGAALLWQARLDDQRATALDWVLRPAQHAGVTSGPNPAIAAEAARKALGSSQELAANQHDVSVEQALLNEADLHELEQAEYYPQSAPRHVAPPISAKRSLLDRLLGRGSR